MAEAQAAGACYYPLPGGYTARVWDDRSVASIASRVDFCDPSGRRAYPPPFIIRCGWTKDEVLGDVLGVTTFHPYGGAYSFYSVQDPYGEPVLILSYCKPVPTLIRETKSVAWQPTQ
jgi:hypothetical protein